MIDQQEQRIEYTRQERIDGFKRIIEFLETNPEFDIPESIDESLVRTLPRQNRGQLKSKAEVAEWFLRHVNMLCPDRIHTDTDFVAVREFGGGARITLYVSASEVCEKTVETTVVNRLTSIETPTWQCPEALVNAGFTPDQEKLRERERSFQSFIEGRVHDGVV